jgi:hypothetical protein
LLALSLNACQLAVWEIAEPHVRDKTNKQVQVFIIFFMMFGFKLLLARREITTPSPIRRKLFFSKKTNYFVGVLVAGQMNATQ